MKTAVSIPEELFEAVCEAAEEEGISRSRVFADAIRNYLEQRENRKLLADLNASYSDDESTEDKRIRKLGRKNYARRIVKEKW